jgi:poly-gamma-glutamate biosynthesis protein PgsC/CapC
MTHVLFIGIVVSLLVTELTGFSPGGVVVVGYLAMFFAQPVWQLGTLAAALITFGLVQLLERRLILYGRRQFAMYVLTGILVSQGAVLLSGKQATFGFGLLVIGYLVPGLIARDFGRQGILATVAAMVLAVALTQLLVWTGEGFLW